MPIIDRTDLDGWIPEDVVTEIIDSAAVSSLALSTFRRVNMGSSISHLPVLDALPTAYWVTGELGEDGTGGEKRTTEAQWARKTLTAEEVAAIVIIPEAVLEDAGGSRLWDAVLPRLAEAVGRTLDRAVFAGTNAPASFDTIIPDAVAAGNVTVDAAPDEVSLNALFSQVEADGYVVRDVYAANAVRGVFRGLNIATYMTTLEGDASVNRLFGVPIHYDPHGALGTSLVVAGDSEMAILGVRTDMQLKFLDQASIDTSAALDGTAIVNLAQQDAVAYRIRARFGFVVANPVTSISAAATRYPFAVMNPA